MNELITALAAVASDHRGLKANTARLFFLIRTKLPEEFDAEWLRMPHSFERLLHKVVARRVPYTVGFVLWRGRDRDWRLVDITPPAPETAAQWVKDRAPGNICAFCSLEEPAGIAPRGAAEPEDLQPLTSLAGTALPGFVHGHCLDAMRDVYRIASKARAA